MLKRTPTRTRNQDLKYNGKSKRLLLSGHPDVDVFQSRKYLHISLKLNMSIVPDMASLLAVSRKL